VDEHELQDALKTLLEEIACKDAEDREEAGIGEDLAGVKGARTFEDEGVLTNSAGLIVTTADGSEFQLTIVRSH
jgi:hypothetical protein